MFILNLDFPGGSDGKESACTTGDPGSISGLARSFGEGHVNPPKDPYLESSMTEEPSILQFMGSQRVKHN